MGLPQIGKDPTYRFLLFASIIVTNAMCAKQVKLGLDKILELG
jgi:hypothetical protein